VPHLYEGVPLLQAAAAAGVPERTARRWLAVTGVSSRISASE
jgi:hypothetical protein